MRKRVCIIGGGISGLATGHLLKENGIEVALFESSPHAGGNIRSERTDGYLIEHGPNSLLRSAKLVDLIDSLGLRHHLLPSNTAAKTRYVLIDGKLKALPTGIASLLFGDFFSARAKVRLLREPLVRTKAPENESVASFFARRLGREPVEKAVDPFISGIFAGDPEILSIKTAFPKLFEYEQKFGSLAMGAIRSKKEKVDRSFPRSFTFADGLQTLTDELGSSLGDSLLKRTAAGSISRSAGGRYEVIVGSHRHEFDVVIVSTKADAAAKLLERLAPHASETLRSIRYSPIAVVRTGYAENNVGVLPAGFGFLVPGKEKRGILGSLWNSSVFPGRAPSKKHLFTTFVGGARSAELFDLSDGEILDLVSSELSDIMDIGGEPEFQNLTRWKSAIPQYDLRYNERIEAIESMMNTNPGLFICSNFYKGISVGDCVKNAYRTAGEVGRYIGGN
jgi:oxygen-dependent protoporphyrinogen oxidase